MKNIKSETLRYLGCGRNAPDSGVDALVEETIGLVTAAASHRCLHRLLPVTRDGNSLCIGKIVTASRDFARYMDGCCQAVVFAATLGAGVDALLRRTQQSSISQAVIMQAAATAIIEDYCDRVCGELAESLTGGGLCLRQRFSPGYGDLELELHLDILAMLGGQRIGLGCTQSLMLVPTKSVTAIIGCGVTPFRNQTGCGRCDKKDCAFRETVE